MSCSPRRAGCAMRCSALLPLIRADEPVLIGLPDTVWSPGTALRELPADVLSFLLFPVERPEFFDAVVTDAQGGWRRSQVKQTGRASTLDLGSDQNARECLPCAACVCGGGPSAGRVPGYAGECVDRAGRTGGWRPRRAKQYVDVGTLHGYRAAIRLLEAMWKKSAGSKQIEHEGKRQRWQHANDSTGKLCSGEIEELGPWFHNMGLDGVRTAPRALSGRLPAR